MKKGDQWREMIVEGGGEQEEKKNVKRGERAKRWRGREMYTLSNKIK